MSLFSKKIKINNDGWTTLKEPNAEKHILGVSCKAENGTVVEVRIRHNDGEEKTVGAFVDKKDILPISISEFQKLFADDKISFE